MKQESSLAKIVLQRATKHIAAFLGLVFVFQFFCLFYLHHLGQVKEIRTLSSSVADTINFYHSSGDLSGLRRAMTSADLFKDRAGELVFEDRSKLEILNVSSVGFQPKLRNSFFMKTVSKPIQNDFSFRIGTLKLSIDQKESYLTFFYQQGMFLFVLLGSFLVFSLTFLRSTKAALLPLNELKETMILEAKRLGLSEFHGKSESEISYVRSLFSEVTLGWQKDKELALKQQRMAKSFEIARQVTHDIRSPLSALSVLEKSLVSAPENHRELLRKSIQRIREISNNLLDSSRAEVLPDQRASKKLLCSVVTACEDIVEEKRLEFANDLITFQFDFLPEDRLSTIPSSTEDFKRVLSNLVNNAIESYVSHAEPHNVKITLRTLGQFVRISILDQGKGIPPELVEQLGKKSLSFGKQNGNGLGLYHAQKCVKDWGGSLEIESQLGRGTTVSVVLPLCFQESLVSTIKTKANLKKVVIVEDESLFSDRLKSFILAGKREIQVAHYSSPIEFRENYDFTAVAGTLFLLDHDYNGYIENGLGLYKALNLDRDSTYLVTHRYDDFDVLEQCRELGLRMIPKNALENLQWEQDT